MKIDNVLNAATMALVWIGGLLILAVMLVTIGDIIARWVLATGFIGLVDITQFAVIGFAYLALPRVFWTNANVAIELYDERLSPRSDAALRLFACLLAIGVIALLLRYGWVQAGRALRYGDVSQNIEIPMIAFWALILGGLACSGLITLVQIARSGRVLIRGAA
ncbi:MAG: TRAP transporter small permease [Pseudomonadota bacterium]